MIYVLHFLAALLEVMFFLWFFFLAVMSLKRARNDGTLRPWAKIFGSPIFAVGLVLDFIANMIPMTIAFGERPHEWLVTDRVKRHLKNSTGNRLAVAVWLRDELIDPFDPGHCE